MYVLNNIFLIKMYIFFLQMNFINLQNSDEGLHQYLAIAMAHGYKIKVYKIKLRYMHPHREDDDYENTLIF